MSNNNILITHNPTFDDPDTTKVDINDTAQQGPADPSMYPGSYVEPTTKTSKVKGNLPKIGAALLCLVFLVVMIAVGATWAPATEGKGLDGQDGGNVTPSPTTSSGNATPSPTTSTRSPTTAATQPPFATDNSEFEDELFEAYKFAEEFMPKLFLDPSAPFTTAHGAVFTPTSGALVASPGGNCAGNSYHYVWMRDQAAVNTAILEFYKVASGNAARNFEVMLEDYVRFTKKITEGETIAGVKQSGSHANAKYNVDGSNFNGPWCQPQRDGPAARAIVLMKFLDVFVAKHQGTAFASSEEYTTIVTDAKFLIKLDISYLVAQWDQPGCEPWEEVNNGQPLYPMLNIRKAFLTVRNFQNGDAELTGMVSDTLISTITAKAESFWDESKMTYLTQLGRSQESDRIDDVQTVLGSLHTYPEEEPATSSMDYAPHHDKPMANAYFTLNSFNAKASTFNVNYLNKDRPDLGVAIGRYLGDTYNSMCLPGSESNIKAGPWFLATSAMAEFMYKAAKGFVDEGSITINKYNKPLFDFFGGAEVTTIGQTYAASTPEFKKLITKLLLGGDSFNKRVLYHAGRVKGEGVTEANKFRLHEQIHPVTGDMLGAQDLGWSYGAMVTAYNARMKLNADVIFSSYTPADGVYAEVVATGIQSGDSDKTHAVVVGNGNKCSGTVLRERRNVLGEFGEKSVMVTLPKATTATIKLVSYTGTCSEASATVEAEKQVTTKTHNVKEPTYFVLCDVCAPEAPGTTVTLEVATGVIPAGATVKLMYQDNWNPCDQGVVLQKNGNQYTGRVPGLEPTFDAKMIYHTGDCGAAKWQEIAGNENMQINADPFSQSGIVFEST